MSALALSATHDIDALNALAFEFNPPMQTFTAETDTAALTLVRELREAFPSPHVIVLTWPIYAGRPFTIAVS